MDDDIRAGQVQAGSTCFQGNTEYRRVIPVELFHHLCTPLFFRASLQDKAADAFFLQTRGQDLDHRSELGKQQDFVAGFHGTLNQLDAEIEFCRTAFVIFVNKRRITAELTQPRQFREHLEPGIGKFFLCLVLQYKRQPLGMCMIQLLLLLFHAGSHIFLNFVRQILQHFLLQTAQNKRTDHLLQTF